MIMLTMLGPVATARGDTAPQSEAAPAAPEPAALERAKELTRRGATHYALGRFAAARADYAAAYELVAEPALLFNIGQCYRQLGDPSQALFFYRGYLRDAPAAENRVLVEELITETEAELRAERERSLAVTQDPAPPRSDLVTQSPARPFYRQWWFWGATAAVATATAIVVVALSDSTETLPTGSLGTVDYR